jgi:uncharacterized protein
MMSRLNSAKDDYEMVKARDVKLNLNEQTVQMHWFDRNPWLSQAINAMFLIIPAGERWVMNAARDLLPTLKDPELVKATKAFIRQEAMHSREHDRMNKVLIKYGVPYNEINKSFSKAENLIRKHTSTEFDAACAAAFEHFTAILSEEFLKVPEVMETIDPEVRALAIWHMIEEIEHKAVSFDIFNAAVQNPVRAYGLRVGGMLASVGILFPLYVFNMLRLLAHDGELTNIRSFLSYINKCYLSPGFIRKIMMAVPPYFKPSFHPWDHDSRDMIAVWQQVYDETGDAGKAADSLLEWLKSNHKSNAQVKSYQAEGKLPS